MSSSWGVRKYLQGVKEIIFLLEDGCTLRWQSVKEHRVELPQGLDDSCLNIICFSIAMRVCKPKCQLSQGQISAAYIYRFNSNRQWQVIGWILIQSTWLILYTGSNIVFIKQTALSSPTSKLIFNSSPAHGWPSPRSSPHQSNTPHCATRMAPPVGLQKKCGSIGHSKLQSVHSA